MDNKMNEKDVIKAFEEYRVPTCIVDVWYDENGERQEVKLRDVQDLIKRQQADREALIAGQESLQKYISEQDAEIERLKHILNSYALQYGTVVDQSKKIAEIKAEARKEFAERLKSKAKQGKGYLGNAYYSVEVADIDNLLKEMDGKENGDER